MITTTAGTARPARLDSLTSLRAFAALAVLGAHVANWLPGPFQVALQPLGGPGVTFLFVLSGVVLAWVLRPGERATDCSRRRIARVGPSHWVAAVLVRWRDDVLRRVAVVALVGAVLLPAVLGYLLSGAVEVWAVKIFPPSRVLEFVVGVCVGLLLRRGALPRVSFPFAVGALLLAVGLLAVAPSELARSIALPPLVALLVAAAQSDLDGRTRVLGHRALVRLGEWSFCFSLVHQLVVKVVAHQLPVTGQTFADHALRAAVVVLMLVVAWVGGAALHRLVEVPAEARLRVRGGVRRPRVVPDADGVAAAGR